MSEKKPVSRLKAPPIPAKGYPREWQRFDLKLEAAVQILIPEDTFSAHIFVGRVKDLSLRGLGLVIEEVGPEIREKMLARPRFIRVAFSHPSTGEEIRVMGRIVRINDQAGLDRALPCVVGIRLDPLEGVDLAPYERLIAEITQE